MMMTRSPSQPLATINISASAPKLVVNNRISLLYYYRIADNILKQADIFREEGNAIDLYIMLLRFSSLATEAIPYHRDYRASPQSDKIYLKKRLLGALTELEDIKPAVQQTIENLQRKQVLQVNNYSHSLSKVFPTRAHDYSYSGQRIPQLSIGRPVEEQFRQISLNVPPPKEETLSRHSILGPNGLHGQWQPPTSDRRVLYPSNIDWSPVEIPSVRKPVDDGSLIQNDTNNLAHEIAKPESSEPWKKDGQISQIDEPISLISFEPIERPVQTEIIRQPSPPPVLADIHDLIPSTVPAGEAGSIAINSTGGVVCGEAPIELHIPTSIMDSFMRLAKSNTTKNLETCGVLAGALKNRKFCITALIIPKQESTSDSCQTTNEEEIFEVQDKQSLFPLGWIHTHPTQSCFMSSIDIHTHYSYQIMLPEAIAIVMAPTDTSKNHGIFRLTPGGLTVIRQCPKRGFHPHDPTDDGSPIYKQCTDVYVNPNLQFDVIDLR